MNTLETPFTFQFKLSEHRCYVCGSFWYIESTRETAFTTCPRCAGSQIKDANARADAAQRSANNLRGALTNAKRHKAKKQ